MSNVVKAILLGCAFVLVLRWIGEDNRKDHEWRTCSVRPHYECWRSGKNYCWRYSVNDPIKCEFDN